MTLRGYQNETVSSVKAAWGAGHHNVIPCLATGLGKTEIMRYMAAEHDAAGGYGVAIAHRSVLIGQLSMALAKSGVQHDIIATKRVLKVIVAKQLKKFGRSFYNPGARWKVCSVDTLPGRSAELSNWFPKVTMGFTDEAHHVLEENKWGRECLRFVNPLMRWLLPTATPERADRRGLGRPKLGGAGIADVIVEGPRMKWGIDNGYLTNFRMRAPIPADLDLSDVNIGANGEYNLIQLRKAVHRSKKIVGNIVDTYKENTPGMLAVCFAVDIKHAEAITKEFNDKGVRAELVTADDEEGERNDKLDRYAARTTLVLVNVDLFGEGFDLPAIEVVIMARPTASYSLYAQQWGRGGRLGIEQHFIDSWEDYTVPQRLAIIAASAKPVYYVHDHVGNVLHFFGPPTKHREFSLTSTTGRSNPTDAIPMRVCLNTKCQQPFERFYLACPYCGRNIPLPLIPTLPAQADGDIALYTSEMCQRLFGVDTPEKVMLLTPDLTLRMPTNLESEGAARKIQANHNRKIIEQQRLAKLMPLVMPPVLAPREAARKFYHQFAVDVVAARLLGGVDTAALNERIMERLTAK